MSKISPLAQRACPGCGTHGSLYVDPQRRLRCRNCDYMRTLQTRPPEPQPLAEPTPPTRRRFVVSYSIEHPGPIDPWAQAAYHTGLDHVQQENYPEAIRAFKRALESERDMIDAHLWLGRLAEDATTKRHHLGEVIAQRPNHLEAMRELMVLNGEITAEEASLSMNAHHQPQVRTPGAPVSTRVLTVACPVCGGRLRAHPGASMATCESCSHQYRIPKARQGNLQSLTAAMLKRRGQAERWDVGQHLVHCNYCGAGHLLTGRMATQCPFCGSDQVIERDALDSFQKPDGILVFKLGQQDAERALDDALRNPLERVKGWFNTNKVRSVRWHRAYIPFWFFDTVLNVRRTEQIKSSYDSLHRPSPSRSLPHVYEFTEMANNVAISAVSSPPSNQLEAIADYYPSNAVPYDASLLSGYIAELYTLDFDQASLKARKRISQMMRQMHSVSTNPQMTVLSVTTLFQQMTFQLIMAPVWIGNITEQDEDQRQILVNGQTGTTSLSQATPVRPRRRRRSR